MNQFEKKKTKTKRTLEMSPGIYSTMADGLISSLYLHGSQLAPFRWPSMVQYFSACRGRSKGGALAPSYWVNIAVKKRLGNDSSSVVGP